MIFLNQFIQDKYFVFWNEITERFHFRSKILRNKIVEHGI